MNLDLSKVSFSCNDIRRKIILPTKMTNQLAEDIGIMIGDGCLSIYKDKKRVNYDISCIGNLYDEKSYYESYIKNLKLCLFNLKFGLIESKRDSTCILRAHSKGIIEFYSKSIGLPIGKKDRIGIPSIIFSKRSFLISCIRGIGDSDFSLTFKRKDSEIPYYPVIKIISKSRNLIGDLNCGLKCLGFKPTVSYDVCTFDKRTKNHYISHSLDLNGKKQVERWMELIKFNNTKNLIKYRFWKNNGVGPSKHHLLEILNKSL